MQFAYIEHGKGILDIVKRYLPSNYTAEYWDDYSDIILIKGEDIAGWTMDDYVIPRLRSGNYIARKVK